MFITITDEAEIRQYTDLGYELKSFSHADYILQDADINGAVSMLGYANKYDGLLLRAYVHPKKMLCLHFRNELSKESE